MQKGLPPKNFATLFLHLP
uniref:Uncharacterized protein n=1 Tax=Amphimedon queenslandica TaxID=400682 RepID=A0A1X7VDF1_AMPQE